MTSIIITAFWTLLALFSTNTATGWRMEGFNPSRTNVSTVAGPNSRPDFEILASSVPGDLRRIADDGSLILTDGGSVYSYTRQGQHKWHTDVFSSLNGTVVDVAVSASGTVYASSKTSLVALDGRTGEPVWLQPFVANFGDDSAPLIVGSDGTIYFHTGSTSAATQEKLSAINPDGTLKWEYIGNAGSGSARPVFSNDGSTTYIPQLRSADGRRIVVGLSTASGQVVSATACDVDGRVFAYAPSDVLYTGNSNNNLLQFPPSTLNCSVSASGVVVTDIVAALNSKLVVKTAVPGAGESYAAIDAQGRNVWFRVDPLIGGFAGGSGREDDATFFSVAPKTNEVVAISVATGEELWRQRFSEPVSGLSLGGDGNLYLIAGGNLFRSRSTATDPAPTPVTAATVRSNLSGSADAGAVVTAVTGPSGLVAAYSFNEGTGTTVADSSGNGNTGTVSNGTWTTSGKYGNSLLFNGTSTRVTINDSASLHLTTGMTLETWVFPTAASSGYRDIIYKQDDQFMLEASSTAGGQGPTGAGTFGDGFQAVGASSALAVNAWTHVAVTFDGANLTVWINGVSVASQPQTAPLTTSTMPLQIGGDSLYGQYFKGRIDEVRIYNRALSKAELEVDMNSPIGSIGDTTAPTAPGNFRTFPGGAPASVVARQSYINPTALTTHTTAAFDSTGGDLIVVFGSSHENVATMTISDNKSNTWISARGPTNHSSASVDLRSQIWYAKAANVGTGHTVTLNLSAAQALVISVFVIKGSNTTAPIDVTSNITDDGGVANTSITSSSITTTQPADLLIDFAKTSVGVTWTAGSGYTFETNASSNYLGGEDTIAGAAGSYSAGWTFTPSANWQNVLTSVVSANAGLSNSQITMTWNAATDNIGVTGYLIERCTGSGCSNFAQIGSTSGFSTTSYTDTALASGTTYTYRVRAKDAAGNLGAYSNTASSTTTGGADTTPPTAPTNLSAAASGGTVVNLSWTASTDNVGVTGYQIERCQGSGCSSFAQVGTSTSPSYSDTGLTSAVSYSYRVRATDAAGNLSGYSNTASATTADTVAPSVPSSLTASVAGATEIDLSWTASTDNVAVTGYLVERCQGTGCSTFAQIASPTTTTYNDTSVSLGVSYSYRVRATDAAGNLSGYSNTASGATADTVPPTAPTSLTAAASGGTQINLTWTASTDNVGVTGYRIERCQGSGCSSFVQVGTSTSASYSDTGLTSVTTYLYRVRATDAASNLSGYSNTASATTADSIAPSAPSSLTATVASGTEIDLSWTASTDNVAVTGYLVERCQGTGCSTFAQIASPTTTTYNDTSVSSGASYTYRVRATDAAGNLSGYSNTSSATTPDTVAPTAPTSLSAAASGGTQINLTWTASTDNVGVTGYQIERCQGSGCSSFVQVGTSTSASYSDTGLTSATTYLYRVRATDAAGNLSGYSNTASATTADTIAPSAPSALTATAAGGTQINLSWTASTDNVGVTGYRVERCQGAGCSTFTQIATPTTASYSDTGLTSAVSYSYRVRANDAAGNLSGYSNTASATTADTIAPSVPTNLTATAVSSSQINLSWTASTDNVGVTGYLLERCQGAGCTTFAQIATPAGTSYSDTPVTGGATYSYRVRATDAANNLSGYSSVATATTPVPDTTPPTVPSNPKAYAGGPAPSIIAVQSYINPTFLTSHTTASFDSTGGDLIVMYTSSHQNVTFTPSDSKANTWISAVGPTTHSAVDLRSQVWYAKAANVGTGHTVTINLSIAQPLVISIFVIKGSNTTNPIDVISSITDDGGIPTNSVTSATVTTHQPADVLIDFAKVNNGVTWTAGTGYTYETAASSNYLAGEDSFAAAAGPYSANWTTDLTVNWQNALLGVASANAVTSASQITISWAASSDNIGVTGYLIERCSGVGCVNFVQVGTSTGTTYTDSALTAGATYSYRIRATDGSGNLSGYSTTVSATTTGGADVTPPTSPTNLSAAASGGTVVNLSWTASTDNVGVTGYQIERCQGTGCTNFLQIGTSTSASYSDSGLTSATTYNYRVRATDAAGNLSGYSNTASATTADTVAPSAPSNLTATAGSSQMSLSWTASTDNVAVTAYQIERCQGSGCTTFAQIGTSTVASYSDTGLTPSTSYSYRVRATDAAGNLSGYSNVVSTSTVAPPTAPSSLTATAASATQVNLSWTASTSSIGILNYSIERCQGLCGNFVQVGTSTTAAYTDNSVASGVSYNYRVRANDTNNTPGGYSNTATVTTPDIIPPTNPTNLTASPVSPIQINLTWTESTDNTFGVGYQIERCPGAGCTNFVQINSILFDITGNWNSYADKSVAPSTTYSYRIRAIDNSGNVSGYSNTATATTPADTTAPTAPSNSVAFAGGAPASIIQWQEYNVGNQLTTHTTNPIDTTGGDLILVYAWTNTTVSTMSLSDSKGNTWISAAGPTNHSSSLVNMRTQLWYAKAALVGTGHTFTMNLSSASGLIMRILVIKGSNTTAPIDALTAITDNGGTQTTTITSAPVTTSQPGDLLVDFAKDTAGIPNPGAGYTDYNSSAIPSEYAFGPVAGTYTAGWALAGAGNWQTVLTSVISANATLSSSQLTVTWNSSTDNVGVTGYLVERCAGAACSNFAQIASLAATATSYTDTGVPGGTTYSYRVRATDAAGNLGAYSSTVTATTTDATPPTAPTSLSAAASGGTQINLSWTASTDNVGVTGYQIERCQGSGCSSFAQVGTSTSPSYSDTGLTSAVSYSYRVRATDAAGNLSGYSNTASATTADTVAPTAPTLTATVAGGTEIDLSWTASTDNVGVTGYLVERCQGTGCSTFTQIASPTTTTYNDTSVSSGVSYSYRVRATDAAGNLSSYSNTASAATTDTIAPTAPTSLSAAASGGTQINLTWTASTDNVGVTGYQIERCQGSGCSSFVQVGTSTSASYSDTSLTSATTYLYRVRATDAAGNLSGYSNTASATTPDTIAPSAPSSLTTTASSGTQVDLSWTASTDNVGVTGYLVERCQGTGCSTFAQIASPTAATYSDTTVSSGVSYSYRVRATDAAGNLSAYSNTSSATMPDTVAPTAPTSLSAAASGGTQINLTWTASTDNVGVTGYQIERCQGSGCSSFVQVATSASASYSDTGLTSATTYLYRVRATDAAGNLSGYSNTASATTADTIAPSAPSALTATAAGGTQINLSWTASTDNVGVTGYRVERCQGAGCTTFTQIATPTTTSYSDTGLTSAVSYSYRVRAVDAAGNLSGYSNTASATTADTIAPSAPANLTAAAVSSSQINLSWTASTDNVGVTAYLLERCQGAGCTTFAQIATPAGTSYSDTGLTAGASYSYRVRATDAANNLSGYSGVATATPPVPDTTPPTAPSGLTATASGTTQINLSWTASTDNVGVTGYLLERCQGTGCSTFAQIATPAGTTYSNTGLTAGTSYSYRVRATDAAGNLSGYSNVAGATTTANTGLVAAYSFNEGTGTTVADLSGNGNTGTISGATWTASGKYSNALSFNGTSSLVTINDSNSLHLTSGMTLEAWVYPTNIPYGFIDLIYKQDDRFMMEASSTVGVGPLGGGTFGDGFQAVAGPSPLTLNTWTHVAVTFDSANMTVWLNGVAVASQPETAPLTTSTQPLQIGGDSLYGQYFTGRIDEVRVYNRALSRNEIEVDMNTPVGSVGDTTAPTVPGNVRAFAGGTPASTIARQSYINSNSATTHTTATFDSTGGDLIVVFGSSHENVSTLTISDNKANTWLTAAGPTNHPSSSVDLRSQIWYAKAAKVGTGHTITITLSTAQSLVISVFVIKGSNTTAPIDVTSSITDDGGVAGTSITSASITTTKPADLLLDFGKTTVSVTWTAGSGYTFESTASSNFLGAEDSIAGAAGSYSGGWTFTPSANWQNVLTSVVSANASLSNSSITAIWNPSTDNIGVTGYLVERCTGAGCSSFTQIGTTTGFSTTSYTDSGLSPNTSYSYRIRTTDAAGNMSTYSSTVSATTTP